MAKDEIQASANANLPALTDSGVLTGVDLRSAMQGATMAQKRAVLAALTAYVGAQTEKVDNYLGQRLMCKGLVLQKATVKLQIPVVDADGVTQEYGEAERVVIKVDDTKGGEHMISFVSLAVASFSKSFLIPMFGMGDWAEPCPILIRQTSNARGRTYNLQVVE